VRNTAGARSGLLVACSFVPTSAADLGSGLEIRSRRNRAIRFNVTAGTQRSGDGFSPFHIDRTSREDETQYHVNNLFETLSHKVPNTSIDLRK